MLATQCFVGQRLSSQLTPSNTNQEHRTRLLLMRQRTR
jgi:hypothetical protein